MDVRRILKAKGTMDVHTIPETATVAEFVKMACAQNVGAMVAVDGNGSLTGIITERDVMRQINAGVSIGLTPVSKAMTRNVVSAQLDGDMNEVMDLMIKHRIRHLPVLDGKEVMGLITVRDILFAMREADREDVQFLVKYLEQNAGLAEELANAGVSRK